MPSLSVKSDLLKVRPVRGNDFSAPPKMSRGRNWDHLLYPATQRRFIQRGQNAAAAAAAFKMLMQAVNEKTVDINLKRWLVREEKSIIGDMRSSGHTAFVAQINYWAQTANESVYYSFKNAFLLGTIANSKSTGAILTEEYINRPIIYETPPRATAFVRTFLLGEYRSDTPTS